MVNTNDNEQLNEQELLKQVQQGFSTHDEEQLSIFRQQVNQAMNIVQFINAMESAIISVCKLLNSNNKTDCIEAINFFVICHRFNINQAFYSCKQILPHVFSKDQSIRKTVIQAYYQIYNLSLEGPNEDDDEEDLDHPNDKLNTQQDHPKYIIMIVLKLIKLVLSCNIQELTCIEQIFSILMKQDQINDKIIQSLLWIFNHDDLKLFNLNIKKGALQMLIYFAVGNDQIIVNHLHLIVYNGLYKYLNQSDEIVKATCLALLQLPIHYQLEATFQQKMLIQLKSYLLQVSNHQKTWYNTAQEVINLIFHLLHQSADQFMEDIIKVLSGLLGFTSTNVTSAKTMISLGDQLGLADDKTKATNKTNMLSHLIFILGHVSIKMLILIENKQRTIRQQNNLKKDEQDDEDVISLDYQIELLTNQLEHSLVLGLKAAAGSIGSTSASSPNYQSIGGRVNNIKEKS